MDKIILFNYLKWQFWEAPKNIVLAWRNCLWFGMNYFSISFLFKTLFSHWHKYYNPYQNKWDIKAWFESFSLNILSRIIGVILRTFLIICGLVFEMAIFLAGLIVLSLWLLLPLIIILIFAYSLILLSR